VPLPHDDHNPSDDASLASSRDTPTGAWFDDEDGLAPIDRDVPANQADDDATDE
jgi:hypothetical protein